MASCKAKIDWKRPRWGEKKNYRSVPTRHVIENFKKIAKKLKNSIMATIQAKIGWKTPRNRENKNYRSVPFLPDAKQKFQKKQQKNSKN